MEISLTEDLLGTSSKDKECEGMEISTGADSKGQRTRKLAESQDLKRIGGSAGTA